MSVKYEDLDGGILIDNTEILENRADMSISNIDKTGIEVKPFEGHKAGLGGLEHGEEENRLKADTLRTGWREPPRSLSVHHVCPICGTHFSGRTNRVYCCVKCKNVGKQRRLRKRHREDRDFKPYRGTTGEVYYRHDNSGKPEISFIPAFNAESRGKAKRYLESLYSEGGQRDDCIRQVNEVIKK